MALPTTDEEWVIHLARQHDDERDELEVLDRYYEGTMGLSYMHPDVLKEVQERIRPVVIAWPQLVVDTVEERLDVEGFRLPDKDSDEKELWKGWQDNDLDEESQLAHTDALVMRRSYATVGTGDTKDEPLVSVDSPLEMYADIDPRTRKVRAALRRIQEADISGSVLDQYATLYLPDRTVWFRWDGNWREIDRDPHGLGEVPVVPIINRLRLRRSYRAPNDVRRVYGMSELAPIIPLSDAANKLATDMMVAAEFVALPVRGLWGVGPDAFEDAKGNKITAFQAILGRVLTLLENEGREFEWPSADLGNFHKSISELARIVAALAGLPATYLGFETDNPASADAIRSAEARLVKRAERKQRAFGGSWERVMRLYHRIQTGEWDPAYKRLETIWRDAATPTIAQKADASIKLYTAPGSQVPIVPLKQTRQDLGYTDTQITNMEKEDAKFREENPIGTLARTLSESGSLTPRFQEAGPPEQQPVSANGDTP